ncbi:amidohydrolase [Rhizobium leguminosarum bv. trifolii WSM597]|uniref:Amidohydrolase n=2 Tax=Rhizobium leguminosarum bv. trifolii TaxID=386 RepID=A0ABF7QVJ4_RHILW|nr:M20 aminoacylase family protein [Rhizobium leguminosarum]ACI58109.1 amidohydrolase [Rhizobium leguminosarum bv. trifolii WSM2304]EJB06900.1 amidohydrolase [Rhizobium leguminosarum bv. trifolii WSM597]
MPELDLGGFLPELRDIRQHLHSIPEIGLEEHETSDFIAAKLEGWGFQITRYLGKTGLVASLRRGAGKRSIGLRADFDALPIMEETKLPYASGHSGVMHACGHDGHAAMLLGAAWLLSHTNDFSGTVHFIFQPAEENFGGAQLMIDDGLLDWFPCDEIFALHNWPGLTAGVFSSRPGPIAASIDAVTLTIRGLGGHGAEPEKSIDPVVVGSSIVMALQTLASRTVSPHSPCVVTVGAFNAGSVCNVIPDTAKLEISIRATDPAVRDDIRAKIETIARLQAESFRATAEFEWIVGYPATINDVTAFEQVQRTVTNHFGPAFFKLCDKPFMGSEDFSFLLEKIPGAYVLIGNGDSANLHTSKYDFNDEILGPGIAFFAHLVTDVLRDEAVQA